MFDILRDQAGWAARSYLVTKQQNIRGSERPHSSLLQPSATRMIIAVAV
jgi:hypothetical protein